MHIIKLFPNTLPLEGHISEYLKANDHLACDVDSLDMWIKVSLSIDSPFKNLQSELYLKMDRHMTGIDIHNIIQKLCLRIWNQFCTDNKKARQNLYILTNLSIKRSLEMHYSQEDLIADK